MANQMRGQLQVANDIGIRGNSETNIQPLPSSGIDSAMGAVAQQFAGIGERIGQMADKAASREGTEAGRIAGLDPEFRTMRTHTIRGDAFDKAGLDVAETRLRQEVDNQFDAAYTKHAGDATKLTASLNASQAGILAHTPDELRPQLQLLMRGKRLAFSREQARKAAAEAAAASKAAMEQQVSDTLKGLHQRAYALGLDQDADRVLAADASVLQKTLARRGPDGALLVNPGQAAKYMDGVKETVATARLTGAFSRLPSLAAKEEFIKELESDFAGSRGLAKVYDLQGFERIKGALESDLRSARAEHGAQIRAVDADVTSAQKMAAKGFAPSPAEISGLKARVIAAGDVETAQRMQVVEDTIAWQSAARRGTPAELDRFIQSESVRMKQDGATPQAVARLEMAGGLLDEMRRELKQDPLGWADRTGVMPLAPIDASSPDRLSATFKARQAQAEEVAQLYGQDPQYLRPDERRQLAMQIGQGGETAIASLASLANAAGDRAPKVMAEVSQDAPVAAMLGGHVVEAGITPVATDASDGIALLKTDGVKPMAPSAAISRTELTSAVGTALQAMPKAESAAIALANAAYEVRARRKGLTDFDSDTWRGALREVLGERTIAGETYGGVYAQGTWGGNEVIVPPTIKRDAFGDLIESVRMDDLVATGGQPMDAHGKPVSIATVQRARLVSVGAGQYWLAAGDIDGGDPQWIKRADADEPYVLDLKKLEPRLKPRLPDAYLGGH